MSGRLKDNQEAADDEAGLGLGVRPNLEASTEAGARVHRHFVGLVARYQLKSDRKAQRTRCRHGGASCHEYK